MQKTVVDYLIGRLNFLVRGYRKNQEETMSIIFYGETAKLLLSSQQSDKNCQLDVIFGKLNVFDGRKTTDYSQKVLYSVDCTHNELNLPQIWRNDVPSYLSGISIKELKQHSKRLSVQSGVVVYVLDANYELSLKKASSKTPKPAPQGRLDFEDDDVTCPNCKNTTCDDGFFPCNSKGEEIEPIEGKWFGLYVCGSCGTVYKDTSFDAPAQKEQSKAKTRVTGYYGVKTKRGDYFVFNFNNIKPVYISYDNLSKICNMGSRFKSTLRVKELNAIADAENGISMLKADNRVIRNLIALCVLE